MGRGRSKAKQTKVARDLKYSNQDMDLESLAKELHGHSNKETSEKENPFYEDEHGQKGTLG
jgi:hypothetical protein